MIATFYSISIFIFACFFEVGGGYLIWLWLKEDKPLWVGIIGAIALGIYGMVVTLQLQSFGRSYAAYGGFFITFSLLWAICFEGFKPDRYDIAGAIVALLGVCIIMYAPREN